MIDEPFNVYLDCLRCYEQAGRLTQLDNPPGPNWCRSCRTHDPHGYEVAILAKRPDIASERQTADALEALDRPAGDYIRLPFAAFDEPLPAMTPGSVTILAAGSGLGKTTVTTSMVARWMAQRVRCYVLPLEIRAQEWRVGLACHRVGADAGMALTGEYRRREAAGDQDAILTRQQIRAELTRMDSDEATRHTLYVGNERAVNTRTLAKAGEHCAAIGHDVLLVDHIDHVQSDQRGSGIEESKRVLHTALDIAQQHNLKVVLTSQLNSTGSRQNRLARYAPPQLEHLLLHTFKVQVSEQIWGVFRPLDPIASPADLKAAERGQLEAWRVLWPKRTGLIALKLRHRGDKEGSQVMLAYDNGTVRDRTSFEIAADAQRLTQRDNQPPAGEAF